MTRAPEVAPQLRTIHRNDRVVVASPDGSIEPSGPTGFFARDTRLLSRYELLVNGRPPRALAADTTRLDTARFEFRIDPLVLHVARTVADGVHESLDLENPGPRAVQIRLEIALESDFADIFEVRAARRARRGETATSVSSAGDERRTTYRNGGFERGLVIRVEHADGPFAWDDDQLTLIADVPASGSWHACLRWLPVIGGVRAETPPCGLAPATEEVDRDDVALEAGDAPLLRAWGRALDDLAALRLEDPFAAPGLVVPAAGVPWYATLFGRDSLITAMQTIATHPEFAHGSLARLAALQATADDPVRDMEPGKIPHEVRSGELAELGILPFQPYYGTHDATSLFVIAWSELARWSGDRGVLNRHLAAAEAAVAWIDRHGDRDGDGFQEYATRSAHGHRNQGWKDAHDAIRMANGTHADLPIALCEFQAYAYDAKLRLAEAYEMIGRPEDAAARRAEAADLRERFNETFWWEAEGTYYLGLDGAKRPIESVASNAGHCLASGIVPPERAGRLVDRLLAPDMWSGWGIRTLSSDHAAYDPLSSHNGSVWPHDNAWIAAGMRRVGRPDAAAAIARAIVDAADAFPDARVPELYGGQPRREGAGPVPYPDANVPQAWAAGAIVQLVTVLCGLDVTDGSEGVTLHVDPVLPDWLPEVTLHGIRVGTGRASLRIRAGGFDVLEVSPWIRLAGGPPPGRSPTAPGA